MATESPWVKRARRAAILSRLQPSGMTNLSLSVRRARRSDRMPDQVSPFRNPLVPGMMGASRLVSRARSLKSGLVLMMPRAARVSATTESEAPAGTRTRIGSPDGVPEHAATTHVNASTVATRGLLTNPPIEVGLEDEERRG